MFFSQLQPTVEWLFTGETEVLFPGCGVCLQIMWLIPRSLLALRLEVYESVVVEGVRAGGGVFTVMGWILSHLAVVLADNYPCKNHSVTIFGAIEALAKDSRMRGQDNAWQILHVGRGEGQHWAPRPSQGLTGQWAPHPSCSLSGSVGSPALLGVSQGQSVPPTLLGVSQGQWVPPTLLGVSQGQWAPPRPFLGSLRVG